MDAGSAIDVGALFVMRAGAPALDGVSLRVAVGSVTGLLGPSGSGKSTLMRSVVGVQKVASGRVTVLGEPAGSPPLRARVGYLTQAPSIYSDLSVRENLNYFARILSVQRERVDEVIDTVRLGHFAGRIVDRLSGGQRARVSLATALLNDPELLVLDEPTVGLDPVLRRDLWDTFHSLAGYAIAFALVAVLQATLVSVLAFGALGLHVVGPRWAVVALAVANATLGMALGLFVSAFATTEFQAVQFMPAIVFPQMLLSGLFVARTEMARWLQWISDGLPLVYAYDALARVARNGPYGVRFAADIAVTVGAALLALALGAATLRRRTA